MLAADFERFHPLDHRPFTDHCESLHGGSRLHLRLAWALRWRPRLRRLLGR
jgi:hypothetical protein